MGDSQTQPSNAFPPQLFKIHLVSDIPQKICFFGSAPNEGGFKDSTLFHDLFCLNLYKMLCVSSSANVFKRVLTLVNMFLSTRSLSSRIIYRKGSTLHYPESPRDTPAPAEIEHVPWLQKLTGKERWWQTGKLKKKTDGNTTQQLFHQKSRAVSALLPPLSCLPKETELVLLHCFDLTLAHLLVQEQPTFNSPRLVLRDPTRGSEIRTR